MPKGKGPGAPFGNKNAAGPHKGYHGRTTKNIVTRSLKHVTAWGLRMRGSPAPHRYFSKGLSGGTLADRTATGKSRTEQVKSILRSGLMGLTHYGRSTEKLAFRTTNQREARDMKLKKIRVVKPSKTYHGRMNLHWSEARKFRNRRR